MEILLISTCAYQRYMHKHPSKAHGVIPTRVRVKMIDFPETMDYLQLDFPHCLFASKSGPFQTSAKAQRRLMMRLFGGGSFGICAIPNLNRFQGPGQVREKGFARPFSTK